MRNLAEFRTPTAVTTGGHPRVFKSTDESSLSHLVAATRITLRLREALEKDPSARRVVDCRVHQIDGAARVSRSRCVVGADLQSAPRAPNTGHKLGWFDVWRSRHYVCWRDGWWCSAARCWRVVFAAASHRVVHAATPARGGRAATRWTGCGRARLLAGHRSARKRQIAEVIGLIAEPAAVVDLLDDVPALLARSVASWSVADDIARRRRHGRHPAQRPCRRRRLA
jgi:hypothetical protein